ncbi:MAG: DUF1566 domain-containing protein [Nitrospirae bacterium]|uniref:Lcl domain-containing protein n=1 Tax=Candidatus Magnetobacterium casense TaxID=1455061 RepID=UPI00058C4972|nr:DUF1566 domain-containing protein [Candidatus Magnetobacterium casensis]MBF0338889.1 DUF1566 domain-containing protein [Nitrospirota bacterium]
MFCSKCGTKNNNDSAFCEECGAALSNARPEVAVTDGSKKQAVLIIAVLLLVMIVAAASYMSLHYYAEKKTKETIGNFLLNNPDVKLSYKELNVSLISLDVKLKNVTMTLVKYNNTSRIDEVVIHKFDRKNQTPNFLHISFLGVEINDALKEQLQKLGYNNVKVNSDIQYAYNEKIKEFFIKMAIENKELLSSSLEIYLANVEKMPDFKNTKIFSEYILKIIKLKSIEFTYTDNSLLERLIKREGLRETIAQASKEIDELVIQCKNVKVKKSLESIRDFLLNHKKITISMKPTRPTTLYNFTTTELLSIFFTGSVENFMLNMNIEIQSAINKTPEKREIQKETEKNSNKRLSGNLRYKILKDIVEDTTTSLQWPKDGGTPTVENCVGGGMNWYKAFDYIKCLNSIRYLGYTDWHLPTKDELQGLQGFLISLKDPIFANVQFNGYWSSTTDDSNKSGTWAWIAGGGDSDWTSSDVVDVGDSGFGTGIKSGSNYVWPVRALR